MAGPDRRIRRTRRTISAAFVALILEKGYERITVQHILDRADVGRSTFYSHYRDKEALLTAIFEELSEQLRGDLAGMPSGVPVEAVFGHAYRHRAVYRALCGRQGGNLVHRHLHRLIGGLLRERLRPHLRTAGSDLPVAVIAEFYTSAALGLLTWWVDNDFRPGPAELTHIYQRLAGTGLDSVLGDADAVSQSTAGGRTFPVRLSTTTNP